MCPVEFEFSVVCFVSFLNKQSIFIFNAFVFFIIQFQLSVCVELTGIISYLVYLIQLYVVYVQKGNVEQVSEASELEALCE